MDRMRILKTGIRASLTVMSHCNDRIYRVDIVLIHNYYIILLFGATVTTNYIALHVSNPRIMKLHNITRVQHVEDQKMDRIFM